MQRERVTHTLTIQCEQLKINYLKTEQKQNKRKRVIRKNIYIKAKRITQK